MKKPNGAAKAYSDALKQITEASKRDHYAHIYLGQDLEKIPEEILQVKATYLNLFIHYTNINDFSILTKLETIKRITIVGGAIADFGFLDKILGLRNISVRYVKLSDLECLSNCKDLTDLELAHIPIRTMRPLLHLEKLARISISNCKIREIGQFSYGDNIRELSLRDTDIEDINPLKGLNNIFTLDLSGTQIENITALAGNNSLRYLNISGTKVSNIGPLNSTNLWHLNLANTNVSDLSSLSSLSSLQTLDISQTRVANLQPIENLTALEELRAVSSLVSDITPLSGLRRLRRLDISQSRVSDLSPLAELTLLARGPRGGRTGGLFLKGCPIRDPNLRAMIPQRKAERAENVISYVRRQQGLPVAWEDEAHEDEVASETPAIPAQGVGPHFQVAESDGAIHFASPEDIDEKGNNVTRLANLHPALTALAREVSGLLRPNEQPELLKTIHRYLRLIDCNLNEINFDLLYGEGLYLEEASIASKRNIANRIAPPLEDPAEAALNSLTRLHSVFILSSKAGLENIQLAERYEHSRQEETVVRETAFQLANNFKNHPEIVSAKVIDHLDEIASQMALPDHPERIESYRSSMIRNVVIVLTAGASIAALPIAGAHLSGLPGGVMGTGASYLAVEGLKKSAPFLAIVGMIKKGIDQLTNAEIEKLLRSTKSTSFKAYLSFVLENEPLLRALAGNSSGSAWLRDHLDWLKEISNKLEGEANEE